MASLPKTSGPRKQKQAFNNSIKYSGLGLQLLITLLLCGWLGHRLDQYLRLQFPLFLLLFGLMGFVGILYKLYKMVTRNDP